MSSLDVGKISSNLTFSEAIETLSASRASNLLACLVTMSEEELSWAAYKIIVYIYIFFLIKTLEKKD